MSHGESFLAIFDTRFDSPGFYCLDEPEAALSFASTLTLISTLHRIAADGGQVLCATHSPVFSSMGTNLMILTSGSSRTGARTSLRPRGTCGT